MSSTTKSIWSTLSNKRNFMDKFKKPESPLLQKSNERSQPFNDALRSVRLDLDNLRTLCMRGIPEEGYCRPLCWRFLLNYIPLDTHERDSHVESNRKAYAEYVDELTRASADEGSDGMGDHPLNPNPTSAWWSFFKDNDVLNQIDKDVRRLCPEISFFQQATEYPCRAITEGRRIRLCKRVSKDMLQSEILTSNRSGGTHLVKRKQAAQEYHVLQEGREAHWEVVERILFIYSKLNSGVSYVQGMNEILGPIYYVFATDMREEWKAHAEADAFFCFQNVMSELKDYFISKLDGSNIGIESLMNEFCDLLARVDPKLHNFLMEDQKILPQFYAFRWISLLMSQEFALPDVIRVWDSLFSDENRFELLLYLCVVMLTSKRDDLLSNEFIYNMKLLQNYQLSSDCDVSRLLARAVDLRAKRKPKSPTSISANFLSMF